MLAILLKYRARMFFSFIKSGTRQWRTVALLIAFGFLCMGITVMCVTVFKAISADPRTGGEILNEIVSLFLHGIFVLLLFTGLSLAVFAVFFGKDLELLFSLPIKSSTVFYFKFIESLVLNVRFSLLFVTPVLIMLGLFYKASVLYYLFAVAIVVFLASIPGSLGIILSSLIVGRISRGRIKNMMALTGSLLGVGIWAGMNMLMGRLDSDGGTGLSSLIPASRIASSAIFGFLPSGWASRAAIGSATGDWLSTLTPILLLAGCSAALSYLAMSVTAKHYAKGAAEESPEGSAVSGVAAGVGRSPLLTHIKRDYILLVREPQVSMQILLMLLLILLYPFLAGYREIGQFGSLQISSPEAIFALIFGSQFGSRLIPMERLGFCWNLMIPGGALLSVTGKFIFGLASIVILIIPVGLFHVIAGKASGLGHIVLMVAFSFAGFGIGFPMGLIFGDFKWDNAKRMLKGGGIFLTILLTIISGMGIYVGSVLLAAIIPPVLLISCMSASVLVLSAVISGARMSNLEWLQ